MRAEPSRVPTTSRRLTSRVSPALTPASIMASATRKTYAGPDPETPVTASSWRSGSRTTVPTDPRMPSAQSRSAAVAALPPDMPATPAPISEGVLGMARTTTSPGWSAASSRAVDSPATIESTRLMPDGGQRAEHRLGHVGLDGQQTSASAGHRPVGHRQPGMGLGQTPALGGVRLAHGQVLERRPPPR